MRRGRDGELLEDDTEPDHRHSCDRGWLGEDHLGRPIPCLTCKPHLNRRRPANR